MSPLYNGALFTSRCLLFDAYNPARQKIIVAIAVVVSFALIVGVNGLGSSRDDSNDLADETENVASNDETTESGDILSEIPGIACWVNIPVWQSHLVH